MHNDLKNVLLTEEDIQNICKELGAKITEDYKDRPLVCVGILKGSVMFMADLIKRIDTHLSIDFMDVSSYGDELTSTGNVRILKDLDTDVAGRHVLLVEDIVDTGHTAQALFELFAGRHTASTKLCTLLDKPERRTVDVQADYIGIPTPNEFVVGYGLDYRQHYRNLPYIGVLKPAVYQ